MSKDFCIDQTSALVRLKPDEYAECSNELLYGEHVQILNDNGHWGLAKSKHDGYEGYIQLSALKLYQDKTHKVFVPSTHIYDVPNFKFSPRAPLHFLSHVCATVEKQNGFIKLINGGWVFETHLAPIDYFHQDPLEVAVMFLSAPYIWGGRSMAGIDCSGLVQVSLMAAGVSCPRDTGPQSEAIGEIVDTPQRGDFVFFDGHVGIMVDEGRLLNATARHMRVAIEPLSEVAAAYNGITAIRRIG